MHAAPVVQITDGRERHRKEDGTSQFRYKKIRAPTKEDGMGLFPLLYRYGKEPLDTPAFVDGQNGAGTSSDAYPNLQRVRKIT